MIIDRLIERISELRNPSVVGLDPHSSFVPDLKSAETDGQRAAAVLAFNAAIIDAVKDVVPAVKPQIAFYEVFGAAGFEAYWQTVKYAKESGMVVICDIKRGDIASTAWAYSIAHLGGIEGGRGASADFITVNPYLGFDTVTPYLYECAENDKGLFILVKTSNPGSGDIQDLICGGKRIYEIVGEKVAEIGTGDAHLMGEHGYSCVGAVVGATKPRQAASLRALMPKTFFLVPGYGAQGGGANDAAPAFDSKGGGAIVNSSRGIIAAYMSDKNKGVYGEDDFAEAARQAAIDMRDDLRAALGWGE